jgi:hypothetical protein
VALIQSDQDPYKKRRSGHRHMEVDHKRTQEKMSSISQGKRSWEDQL